MNIKKLYLKNYRSYEEGTISFEEDMYMILGNILGTEKSNGSGKSSIVKAICDVLYGTASEEDIKEGKKKAIIGALFELDGKDYKIKRALEKGRTQKVVINNKKYGVKESRDIIESLIGASYGIFKNTSYFQQGDLDSFSKLTPRERKEVAINILQLGIYNDYEKITKERISELKSEILTTKTKIESAEDRLEDEKEDKVESKYTKKDLIETEKLLENLKLSEKLEEFLEDSQERLITCIKKKYENINDKYRELFYSKQDKEKRVNKLKSLSSEAVCPTCENELNKNEIDKIIKTIIKDIKPLNKKLKTYDNKLKKLTSMEKEVKNIDTSIKHPHKNEELITKIAEIKEELKRKDQDKKKLKKLKKDIETLRTKLKTQEKLLTRFNTLKTAFGRNGIQAFIIENALPEIQTTANDILSGLDTSIRISIDSQKELKKGGKAETLDINVITEHGERSYDNYSGGEKTFIDFALRMALSVILARRSNCKIQTLILDEVFGELDPINKQIISKSLRYIANKFNFKKILIISHAEELKDSCDNILRVISNGKTSKIKAEEDEISELI